MAATEGEVFWASVLWPLYDADDPGNEGASLRRCPVCEGTLRLANPLVIQGGQSAFGHRANCYWPALWYEAVAAEVIDPTGVVDPGGPGPGPGPGPSGNLTWATTEALWNDTDILWSTTSL